MTSNGLILDFGLLVSCLVQIFPGGPILIVLSEALPYFVSTGEMLSINHGVGRDQGSLHGKDLVVV